MKFLQTLINLIVVIAVSGMAKRAEKLIEDPAFAGKYELTVEDVKRMVVPSYSEAASTLIPGWRGSPILLVGTKLDQDGTTIQNAEPVLLGHLFRKSARSFAANKFWNFNDQILLKIQPINLADFKFGDSLRSQLVDGSQINFSFTDKQGNDVETDTLSAQGYKGFCIRIFVIPTAANEAKVKIVLYPVPKDDLIADNSLWDDPRFPGLLVSSTDVDIGVRYTEVLDESFGSPIVPCVLTDQQKENLSAIPPAGDFLDKIAATLRAATNPETKQNHKNLWERWGELKRDGANKLVKMACAAMWPPYQHPTPQG